MKKIILNAVAVLFLLGGSVQAQQMIVDLSTGDPSGNTLTGFLDPVWKVKKPGTNVYISPYITTGRDGLLNLDYQTIYPLQHRVIAPNMWLAPFSGANQYDIKQAAPLGEYQYRLQFNFNKSCSTIVSANLVVDGIFTGEGITDILLNGYSVSWPYSSQPPLTNYIEIMNARAAPNTYLPFTTTIPQEIITLNPGDFANGLNNFFVKVNTAAPTFPYTNNKSAALMIKAHLEINYTNVGVNNLYFNMSGSNNQICNGQTANLNIGLNVSPIANYWLDVNPGGYSQPASSSQLVQVNPTASTTYAIKITDQSNNCQTQLNWPVTVVIPPGPDLLGMGSTEQICFGVTQGHIVVSMPGYPNGYPFQLFDVTNNNMYPPGSNNTPYPINPTSSTHYQVIYTDLLTGCPSVTDWFVTVNYPDPITGTCNSNLKTIKNKMDIESAKMSDRFTIAPNPSNGMLTVSSSNDKELLRVRIIDVTGKLMFSSDLSASDSKTIDISSLKASLYFIEIENESHQIVRKKLVKE